MLNLPLTGKRLFGGLLALSLIVMGPVAHAQLLLNPTRVIIDARDRAATIQLVNSGTSSETYRIALENREMTEAGGIEVTELSGLENNFADTMLVYSPRQVTLEPGEVQTVRVSVRKPASIEDGEYRSHMQFVSLPKPSAANSIESAIGPDGALSLEIDTVVAIAIPVIVRHGNTQASVSLANLELLRGGDDVSPSLNFQFQRAGNQSVYGDLVATYIAPSGELTELSRSAGVAVYVPNTVRQASLPLALPEEVSLLDGEIELVYRENNADGGEVLARSSLPLK